MKTKILIASLGILATSAYAQSSGPVIPYNPVAVANALHEIAASPLHPSGPAAGDVARKIEALPNASDRSIEGVATRPTTVPPSATQATHGGAGGLLVGNGATPVPPPTMYNGVGPLAVKPTPAQLKPAAAAPKEEAPVVIAPAPIVESSSSPPITGPVPQAPPGSTGGKGGLLIGNGGIKPNAPAAVNNPGTINNTKQKIEDKLNIPSNN